MTGTNKTFLFQGVMLIGFLIILFFLLKIVNKTVVTMMSSSGLDKWDRGAFDGGYCGGLKSISCPEGYFCVINHETIDEDGQCVEHVES